MHDETWGHEGGFGMHGGERGGRGERGERGGRGRGGRGGGRSERVFAGPFGPGPFGPGFGPGFGGPGGIRFGGRGPRVRRGDVRAAILDLLGEGQPWNGYQMIQEIAARTDDLWRPSAGSVYPALQQLEDEGLIQTDAGEDRRRMFTLTEAGRQYVEAHAAELRRSWDAVTGSVDDAAFDLRDTVRQVMIAVHQVGQAGSAAQVAQAGKVLVDTRRALYRILAADAEADDTASGDVAGDAQA
jgi:DNA-binding PadR family transcriptional regulator